MRDGMRPRLELVAPPRVARERIAVAGELERRAHVAELELERGRVRRLVAEAEAFEERRSLAGTAEAIADADAHRDRSAELVAETGDLESLRAAESAADGDRGRDRELGRIEARESASEAAHRDAGRSETAEARLLEAVGLREGGGRGERGEHHQHGESREESVHGDETRNPRSLCQRSSAAWVPAFVRF